MMMVFACVGFSACGDDDDDNGGGSSVTIPSGLIGTWHKTDGASNYSISFTFNADGTGTGQAEHHRIISIYTFSFKYTYKSNGNVECDAVYSNVSEEDDYTTSRKLVFNYNGNKLKAVDMFRADWDNAVFEK